MDLNVGLFITGRLEQCSTNIENKLIDKNSKITVMKNKIKSIIILVI